MLTITTYLKNSDSFLSDNCFNQNKNKLCSLHSPAFFKILKEPTLLQKQTIPHIKALLFSFLEPEEQGHGIIMGVPRPHPVTFLYLFFLRPSEVDETKTGCFISNLPISESQKLLGFDYNVIDSWKNVRLKCINLSPRTLYNQRSYPRWVCNFPTSLIT